MKIQDKIRVIRTQKKLSQDSMAESLGISLQAYSKIELGKTKLNVDRAKQIAQILDIDIVELISDDGNGMFWLPRESYINKLAQENEKLKLSLAFKDEIIKQLQKENALLKDVLDLFKNNKTKHVA
ncbi:helix-turn-helix domain-containing protein [Moraxella sp. VT-16-12]|uniref:helix-turn-helix domain-containing protein n=1 Tax=Moraxella sp. VT-16-12 TaxID=2014877 RepID=UPI000B7C841A|nr:helix-turn-helix domain-containing protein [Moraxella sp. VT-16-12]TWV83085.1 helix-turn-helix transcriptional regulator [Moraxella sp. VT-16-12]